jgi:dethiobiotin synthetase
MPHQGLLITGTDTGVGKTFVGCGLAAALRRKGVRVAPFKPAETGCEMDSQSNELVPADAVLLKQASQTDTPLETICPYRFQTPVAPWVASRLAGEGGEIDPSVLKRCFAELASAHDVVLVETAGGILVPLAERFHYGDLARLLDLQVLVVAGSKLGVINHTLLTLEFARSASLAVLGCVLNHPYAGQGPAVATNAEALRRLVSTRLFVIPSLSDGAGPRQQAIFDELATHLLSSR